MKSNKSPWLMFLPLLGTIVLTGCPEQRNDFGEQDQQPGLTEDDQIVGFMDDEVTREQWQELQTEFSNRLTQIETRITQLDQQEDVAPVDLSTEIEDLRERHQNVQSQVQEFAEAPEGEWPMLRENIEQNLEQLEERTDQLMDQV
jgi:hypothetical protein